MIIFARSALSIAGAAVVLAGCGGIPIASGPIAPPSAANSVSHKPSDNEISLHSFDYSDGAYDTYAGLVFDASGNVYGTTQSGGASGCNIDESCGVAFELLRARDGRWEEKVLHVFSGPDALGFWPRAGLIVDARGNLYGTTDGSAFCSGVGCGAVFELSSKSGQWTGKALYQFLGGSDGSNPQAPLTFDAAGNLYGSTSEGGGEDYGTIFELTPQKNGSWYETILHSFTQGEGNGPADKLTFDKGGNLFGTTNFGGADRSGCGGYGCGTAFELKRGTGDQWSLVILHSFGKGTDGAFPVSALTLDPAGNLFGVTGQGGVHNSTCFAYGCGTVFQLTREGTGKWRERILYRFEGATDGSLPRGDLVFDNDGALYGTAVFGGLYGGGNAFRLVSTGRGGWRKTTVHDFGDGKDGANPYSGMIFDRSYNLFGTTKVGGSYRGGVCGKSGGCGTIFEIAHGLPFQGVREKTVPSSYAPPTLVVP